jgi:hypothetical protein
MFHKSSFAKFKKLIFSYLCSVKKIRLIWDFRGPASEQTARHHEIHLREYRDGQKLPQLQTGSEAFGDMHAIAWMVVEERDMIAVRDALRPHRGELYQDQQKSGPDT